MRPICLNNELLLVWIKVIWTPATNLFGYCAEFVQASSDYEFSNCEVF